MKFASCCFATLLVCLVSFQQSSAFKLQVVETNQNENNVLLDRQCYIQNVATGLVIGAVNGEGHNGDKDLFPSTMESLEEAKMNPDQKSMILWEVQTVIFTKFRSVGPYTQSDMQKDEVCHFVIGCSIMDKDWFLFSRGDGTFELRYKYPYSNQIPETCLTAHGLHENLDHNECDFNNLYQSWRLIRHDSN